MTIKFLRPLLPLLILAVMFGCQNQQTTHDDTRAADTTATKPAPKPAPKPAAPVMQHRMGSISMAFPTGNRSTSAILLEKSIPTEVRAGAPFNYMIKVTNLTDLTLDEVAVFETFDKNYAMQSSVPAARTAAGGKASWLLGSLRAGETKTIKVTGNAKGVGSVTNCSSVKWNSEACVTARVVQPRLKLEKRAPAEIIVCDPVPLTFVVSNVGTGTMENVVIEDPLPNGMTTKDGRNTIRINVGRLEAGQSRSYKAMAQVARPGRYSNTATANAGAGLTAKSNTTTTVAKMPVLVLTKNGPQRTFAGRAITYNLKLTNKGDGDARNTMVEDMLPAGTRFVRASAGGQVSGGKVIWSLGTLAPNATRDLSVTVMGETMGVKRNTATAKAYCAKAVAAEASTEIKGIPAILLEVIDLEDPINVGGTETYVITVTNQGSATGTNIKIVCTLESAQQYVSSSGATSAVGASASNRTIKFAPLPALAAKAKASWRVKVKALKAGDVRFKVSMTSDQIGRPVEETEATYLYE